MTECQKPKRKLPWVTDSSVIPSGDRKRKCKNSPKRINIVDPPPFKKMNSSYNNNSYSGTRLGQLCEADKNTYEELYRKAVEFAEIHPKIRPGSEEYRELYKVTIGGSEIAVLFLGKVFDTTREKLIQKKISDNNTIQGIHLEACHWGSFFEKYIRLYTEAICKTTIVGHNICIRDGAFRYSPDGLCVITREENGSEIALVEIKCPWKRIPDGRIPEQYKLQIWSGLVATEGLTSFGVFVDAVIRKCKKGDIGCTPAYDRTYHCGDSTPFGNPQAWGVIKIYSREAKNSNHVIDFGAANRGTFAQMLANCLSGERIAKLDYIKFANGMPDIVESDDIDEENLHLVGVLGIKIMRVVMRKLDPFPSFKEKVDREIAKFQEDVEKARARANASENV